MNLEDGKIEDIDLFEEYEMIPLEPIMYGYGQMNMMPNTGINQNAGINSDMGVNPNMGMNQSMGMQQNMGMNPWMGTQPNMRMNPWMEMSQYNEDMFMNGFNPMGMMYEDASMNGYEEENEESRQLDKYQDSEPYDRPIRPNPQYNDVDSIVRRIEKYNPAIFRRLTRCGIPYAEAKEMVKRIVKMTLMYREE